MSYNVSQLLENLGKPVTAVPNEPIQDALGRMLDYGFSQLPVIKGDAQSRQFYFITYESILMALHNFGSRIGDSGLSVDDAIVKVATVYRTTDDLFELLAGMREMNAALIVDDDRNLTHVVTTYDTTLFFRQLAEDIMHVRDIEHGLRRIINSAFKKADGEIDEQARQAAVEEITSSNKALRKKFEIALQFYLKQHASGLTTTASDWIDRAFVQLLNRDSELVSAPQGNTHIDKSSAEIPSFDNIAQESDSTGLLSASRALRERFEAALKCYLSQQATADVKLNDLLVEDAFKIIYDRSEQVKEFGELTNSR